MVKINQLKRRRKDKFMKEALKLSNKYTKLIDYHVSNNFVKFANECFKLVEEFTCDCSKERNNKRIKKHSESKEITSCKVEDGKS